MIATLSIAELLRRGATVRPDEAVAVAQKLIHDRRTAAPVPPFGPPTPENVSISADGSVVCRSCEVTPAVSEIGILLQAMLPVGTPRVPGALRYAIARALLDVDAPPFDSIDDLSRALARFETTDRVVAVRRLIARTAAAEIAAIDAAEGRRNRPAPTGRTGRKFNAIATGVAAGLALIASGEAMHYVRATQSARTVAAAPAAANVVAPLRATQIPLMSVPLPPPDVVVLHAPRRGPSTARRTIKSARAELTASEDHHRIASARNASGRARRASETGLLSRLRLQWLRNVLTVRPDE